jgi:hypothetical protein
LRSNTGGTKFGPIPCIGCEPGAPPFKIGEAAGSTPITFIFRSLNGFKPIPSLEPISKTIDFSFRLNFSIYLFASSIVIGFCCLFVA